MRLVCQMKPVNCTGSFSCSDPKLTRIWYTGAYSIRVNFRSDYICASLMDRGDRSSWTGDAHTIQVGALVAFGDYERCSELTVRTSLPFAASADTAAEIAGYCDHGRDAHGTLWAAESGTRDG
jgi:hypothetical protein